MNNHLILISRERVIGTEIDETSNLIYTEIKIRTKKYDGQYIQNKDYPHLVEKELTKTEIANFKANIHLYTKVESNDNGTIYQYGSDFKKLYWSLFPKGGKPIKVEKERTHKVCSKCVSLCKNTKSKYKHDKFYCLDTGSFIVNKDKHTCEAFQHVW